MVLAHSEVYSSPAVENVTSSFPVYGNIQTASLGMVIVFLIAVTAYYLLGRMPLSKKERFSERRQVFFAKVITGLVIAAIASSAWDIWWHRAVGRDTFWELPHVFLYGFAFSAIVLSTYCWRRTHNKIWKKTAVVTGLIIVSAPFDNLWHVLFGVEDLSRPVSLSWSPPHVLLTLSTMAALALLLPVLKKEGSLVTRIFFTDIVFAAILSMLFFLIMPFHPTEGWGQVLGFWGAGIFAATWVGLVLVAQNFTHAPFTATRVMIYTLVFMIISYGKETAPGVIVFPHDRPPLWLPVFAYLSTCVLLDLTRSKLSSALRSVLAAVSWSVILFGSASAFFVKEFQYPASEVLKAALAAAVGAFLIAIFLNKKSIVGTKSGG